MFKSRTNIELLILSRLDEFYLRWVTFFVDNLIFKDGNEERERERERGLIIKNLNIL